MNLRLAFFPTLLLVFSAAYPQTSDLAALQSKLTVDCKSIRGHAARIVVEASQSEFNHDVAAAHLEQVIRFHASMDQDLQATGALLNAQQMNRVAEEFRFLRTTCETVGKTIKDLQVGFGGDRPDVELIRKLANTLKNDMNNGYEMHERLKKKLGIP